MVETGGHLSIEQVPAPVDHDRRRQVPGQRRVARNHWPNLDDLAPHDEVKFVIKDRADYEFARDVVAPALTWWRACAAVLFSPVHGVLDARDAGRVDPRGPARRSGCSSRLHKFIWGAGRRAAV